MRSKGLPSRYQSTGSCVPSRHTVTRRRRTPWTSRAGGAGPGKRVAAAALGAGQGGLGQVVLLSGEAGIGKSRLVQALRHHIWPDGGRGSRVTVRPITRTLPSIR